MREHWTPTFGQTLCDRAIEGPIGRFMPLLQAGSDVVVSETHPRPAQVRHLEELQLKMTQTNSGRLAALRVRVSVLHIQRCNISVKRRAAV